METKAENPTHSFYIAVILYESSSDRPNYPPLYEECFVLICASSLEEANAKALVHARQAEVSYQNEQSETITWTLKKVVDVNRLLYDEFEDGSELYARHFRNYDAYRSFELLLSD